MERRAWGSQEGKESAHLRACSCQEVGCMSWADDLCWCNQQATESPEDDNIRPGAGEGTLHHGIFWGGRGFTGASTGNLSLYTRD